MRARRRRTQAEISRGASANTRRSGVANSDELVDTSAACASTQDVIMSFDFASQRIVRCPARLPCAAGGTGRCRDPPTRYPKRPKICLVLSGGGARGAAHVGVIKVLEEYRMPIDCIAGTSMGALVGGAYATRHERGGDGETNADHLHRTAVQGSAAAPGAVDAAQAGRLRTSSSAPRSVSTDGRIAIAQGPRHRRAARDGAARARPSERAITDSTICRFRFAQSRPIS